MGYVATVQKKMEQTESILELKYKENEMLAAETKHQKEDIHKLVSEIDQLSSQIHSKDLQLRDIQSRLEASHSLEQSKIEYPIKIKN